MKINQIWMGARTRRFHTDPMLNLAAQTNADHQWGVAAILYYLCEGPCSVYLSPNLLKAALFHDAAEFIVGDLPEPMKRKFPEVKELHKEAEENELTKLGVSVILSALETRLLKIADSLEAIIYVKMFQPGYLKYRPDWKAHVERTLEQAEAFDRLVGCRACLLVDSKEVYKLDE